MDQTLKNKNLVVWLYQWLIRGRTQQFLIILILSHRICCPSICSLFVEEAWGHIWFLFFELCLQPLPTSDKKKDFSQNSGHKWHRPGKCYDLIREHISTLSSFLSLLSIFSCASVYFSPSTAVCLLFVCALCSYSAEKDFFLLSPVLP